jgi:hypothetical protein
MPTRHAHRELALAYEDDV